MRFIIFFILLAVPYLEFLVFLEVSHVIGGVSALLLTIFSAIFGIHLIRQQGLIVMNRMHETLRRGESPVEDILHSFFLLIAGVFFLLPGFITDSIAILLTIPPVRSILGKIIIKNIRIAFYRNNLAGGYPASGRDDGNYRGTVIEGEYKKDDNDRKNIKDEVIEK